MPEPSLLDALADMIDSALGEEFDGPAVLVHAIVDPLDDDIQMGIKPVDGHPSEHLLGFVAPEDWTVFGIVAHGWAGPMGEGRPSLHAARRRVRTTTLVGRSGAVASRLAFADGGGPLIEEPGEGRMLDVLRRVLQLPTPPPPLFAEGVLRWWLAATISRGERSPRRLSWADVATCHPAVAMLGATGRGGSTHDVVGAARALAAVADWQRVHELALAGWFGRAIDRELAAWFDVGSLARWLSCTNDSLDSLVRMVCEHTTPSAARRLVATVNVLVGDLSAGVA